MSSMDRASIFNFLSVCGNIVTYTINFDLNHKFPMKIIILHGLYMHGIVMTKLKSRLESLGYEAEVITYSSLRIDREGLFDRIDSALSPQEGNALVGHSLGGVLSLEYLKNRPKPLEAVSHVVTLGSPLRGARVAQKLIDLNLGSLLGNAKDNGLIPHEVDKWEGEQAVGSIAGNIKIGALALLGEGGGESDGTVRLEETIINGLADHKVIRASHTSMIYQEETANLIENFLKNTKF